MKVLITGSRTWPAEMNHVIEEMLEQLAVEAESDKNLTVIEGQAKGADRVAALWIEKMVSIDPDFYSHIPVRANWSKFGARAGYMRNRKMLTYKPDVVYAFRNFGDSKGTDMMLKLARESGTPSFLVYLDKDGKVCYDSGPAVTQW